jgi:hypothetical protein
MRSRMRTLRLVTVAVLAVSATATATASAALPEIIGEQATIGIETGKVTFEQNGGLQVSCQEGSAEGRITGPKTLSIRAFSFSKCGSNVGGVCNGEGQAGGDISMYGGYAGSGMVVYVSKTAKEAAITFTLSANVHCEKTEIGIFYGKIRGGVIAPISPLNTATKSYTLTFSSKKWTQTPRQYENEAGEKVTFVPLINFFEEENLLEGGMKASSASMSSFGSTEIKA